MQGYNVVYTSHAIGSPVTFEVSVKPANNFPIDLYLLMDLSASMSDDLENLKTLGRLLGMYCVALCE